MRGRNGGRHRGEDVASEISYDPGNGHGREDSFEDRYENDYPDDEPGRAGTPLEEEEEEEEDDVVEQTEVKHPTIKPTHRERSRQKRLQAKLKRKTTVPLTRDEWRQFIAQKKKEIYFQLAAGSQKIQREPHWTRMRVKTANFISTHVFEAFMGGVILFNIFIIMVETERRCYCENPMSEECPANFPDIWVPDLVCLLIYVIELLMRMYVYQCKFFGTAWNVFDFFVVSMTLMGEFFGSHFKDAVIIRVIRIMRLARMLRLLTIFQELYLMLAGMASTLRTIFWAVIMLIAVLSICALVSVEILKPTAAEVAQAGGFGDCERCSRAYESVSSSMITFFMTLIMGEGIDAVIIPMIEANWYSAAFILGCVAMVYLGLSNLILSVIVEKASEARDHDAFYQNLVQQKLKKHAKKVLVDFSRDADADLSGTMSLEELRVAYTSQDNFRSYFKNMDMNLEFLEYAFRKQDRKGRGELSFEDFAESVIHMRNQEVGPVVSMIRFQIDEMMDEVVNLSEQIRDVGRSLSSHISQVGAKAAHSISSTPRARPEPPQQPPVCATLFGGSWWTESNGGSLDDEENSYYDQGGNRHKYNRNRFMLDQDVLDNDRISHAGSEDLGAMLKRAYEEAFPLDLPHLSAAQQRFAELCEKTEFQLQRLGSLCNDEPLTPARKELFVCSARLLSSLSAAMPRLLDGRASAPLPRPSAYPALPPHSASRQRGWQKRPDQAAEAGWNGDVGWEDTSPRSSPRESRLPMAEDIQKRHHNHRDDDPTPPKINGLSAKLADLRAKNDLSSPPISPGRKEKKRKKKSFVDV